MSITILEEMETPEFRKWLRENFIEYKEENGIKVVSDEFVKKIDSIDPLQIVEEMSDFIDDKEKLMMSVGLLSIHFKKSIMEEISALNNDTYRGMDFDDYVSVAKNLGFKVIYKDEGKDKYSKDFINEELILFNDQHSLLLHVDSFTMMNKKNINHAKLHFNFKPRNTLNDVYEEKLGMGRSYIFYTNAHNGSLDVIDHLANKMQRLLTSTELLANWKECELYLHSHVTKEKYEDKKCFGLKEKMNQFPIEVQEKLTKYNVEKNEVLEKPEQLKYIEEIVDKIMDKELAERIHIQEMLMDGKYSTSPENVVSKEVVKKVQNIDKDISKEMIVDYFLSFHNKSRELIDKDNIKEENVKKVLSNLNEKQLARVEKKMGTLEYRMHERDFKLEKFRDLIEKKPNKKKKSNYTLN